MQNYVVDKSGQQADIFGRSPGLNLNNREDLSYDSGQQQQRKSLIDGGQPIISQTKIINELSNDLKNNFKEEIGKLRDEMSSQQRAFREQLERLKIETTKTNHVKLDAMDELEKVKQELRAQRESERLHEQKLFNALDRHNPTKPMAPLEMLHNYDKPGPLPTH